MNLLIESLNLWGERFVQFAWPMLWQSSVLITILFALDFMVRRRVRATVRYALWLVVMVKLLLPPTLAAPTSIAWWVRPNPPPKPQSQQYVVTYLDRAQTSTPANLYEGFTAGALEVQHARPSLAGWFVTASGTISVSLLLWMMLRWRHVARMVHASSPATQDCDTRMDEAQRRIGLRRTVRLQLTDQPMSPAVCGLFRPVILLPRSLAEQLPPSQLRAVLLHELVHLKRADVLVNCAQALLQIVYWWHPLLWLANARIRRVREVAVDDAVMLALRDESETYAPTLLEVAKLALNRPLASLGLVGIMESRSALRQRIERLANFRPPRKAGLTVLSVLGVVVFSALAVPMEKAPVTIAAHVLTQINSGLQDLPMTNQGSASPIAAETNAATLVQSGKLLLEMGKLDEAEAELNRAISIEPENMAADYYWKLVQRARYARASYTNNAGKLPPTDRKMVIGKLRRIRFDSVSYDDASLAEVVRDLSKRVAENDSEKRGVNFIINPNIMTTEPSINLPPVTRSVDLASLRISLKPPLTDVQLSVVLDAIVKAAPEPLHYSIENYGVMISSGRSDEAIFMREFKVDSQSFDKWLQYAAAVAHAEFNDRPSFADPRSILPSVDPREMESPALSPAVQSDLPQSPGRGGGVISLTRTNNMERIHQEVRDLFRASGVDLSQPKSIFYNDRAAILLVRAAQLDLDAIERLVEEWNTTSPPTVPTGASETLGKARDLPLVAPSAIPPGRGGVDVLSAPSSTDQDRVPIRGDVPWLGKLFRSESNSNRAATNGASWLTELTNIMTGAAAPSFVGRTPVAETNRPSAAPATSFPSNFLDPWGVPYSTNIPRPATVRKVSALKEAQPQTTQRFQVEATRFCQSLEAATGIALGRMETNHPGAGGSGSYVQTMTSAEVTRAVEVFLKKRGVNMDLPGRSAFFHERTSELIVSAPKAELDVITDAIRVLVAVPPQVSIKVRFVEVPPPDAHGSFDLFLENLTASNPTGGKDSALGASAMTVQPKVFSGLATAPAGILTDSQYRLVSSALEQQEGVELLNAPEVVTPSGRQAQIQLVDLKTVVTVVAATNAQTHFVYKTDSIPFGSTLDVIPHVLSDGRTISLTVVPTVTEFLGYGDPQQSLSKQPGGAPINGQLPLPRTRIRQITASATVQDGQTLVLTHFPDQEVTRNADGSETQKPFNGEKRRQLVVFVTPTLIDPAGNALHLPQPTSR